MEKKELFNPEIQFIQFNNADVIVTSGCVGAQGQYDEWGSWDVGDYETTK